MLVVRVLSLSRSEFVVQTGASFPNVLAWSEFKQRSGRAPSLCALKLFTQCEYKQTITINRHGWYSETVLPKIQEQSR